MKPWQPYNMDHDHPQDPDTTDRIKPDAIPGKQQIPQRYDHTIRGMGLQVKTPDDIRRAEAAGSPMNCDLYPIPLDILADIIARLDDIWKQQWLPAQELPEYVRRDSLALSDMDIIPMPRLLGSDDRQQQKDWLMWHVAPQDNDDPTQMGRIRAKSIPSRGTFVEFWLGGFPDLGMFDDTRLDIEQEIGHTLLEMSEAPRPLTPQRPPSGDGRATHATSEPNTQTPTGDKQGPPLEVDRLLPDLPTMRQHYEHYSPITAQEILEAIPRAWHLWCHEGGRWGPGFIGRVCNVTAATVGRYLSAFKKAGLSEMDGIRIP